MRKLFCSLLLIGQLYGQSIWLSMDSASMIPVVDGQGIWQSKDTNLAAAFNDFNVIKFETALSNSRKPELQKVYELTCNNCDINQLGFELKRLNSISGIEPGPAYSILYEPDDYNLEFTSDYALDRIDAKQAWDVTTGNPNVVLAISDQNFYHHHEELEGKWIYYDSANTLTRTHGTAVATIAAGNTNNNMGKSSIGFDCRLALFRMNYNELLNASYLGYRVLNASWSSSCSYNKYVHEAIQEMIENGSILVASAGNGTTCGEASAYVYPASYPEVISVTSVGPNDNHERTPGDSTSTHQHNDLVDLSAPGYDVALTGSPGWYSTSSGSSFAAPYVTGTIGLMLSFKPCLNWVEIEHILKTTSDSIDHLNNKYSGLIGAGRLNAGRALTRLQNYPLYDLNVPDTLILGDSLEIKAQVANGYRCKWEINYGAGFVSVVNDSIFQLTDSATLKITSASYNLNTTAIRCVVYSDTFSCQDTSVDFQLTILDTMTSGLKALPLNFSIDPNPVKDVLNIHGLQAGDAIEIQSILGQRLHSEITKQSECVTVALEQFPQGCYWVTIIRQGFRPYQIKMIKQ